MDIAELEQVLNKISQPYEIKSYGLDIKFGFLLGRFSVYYDKKRDDLRFGSPLRWILYLISFSALGYLMMSFDYSPLQASFLFIIVIINFVFTIIRELRIYRLKKRLYIQ
ncbi:hypothetical protein [Photobacterium angustum]|uniref:hypothetical protein n=1 Tax=Photobacterium angustum TaxID=661 RepID=UPI0005DDE41C|nr:hypothetical protein [Photobacterium angustum]KJG01450.1 hypothetical protein UB35_12685 [Photobacterium angustum]KJG05521.1 hypothetical protein UB33_13590 [Photobacterium angustum]KJG16371.1 hypothetical protein UA33_14740 [Photobacterium angustum]KJG22419.1 hypothetical protein UA39_14550 [Photobacterium angustum]KJG28826.1 hypothetical protein UA36_16615 [Photobacterium angustum]